MTAVVLRGDARRLPLPDACVDLIVTSPPYFGLRSYTDNGAHYESQIGSEASPREWLAALAECTAEWMRVLKPSGSIFVNLGDKYAGSAAGGTQNGAVGKRSPHNRKRGHVRTAQGIMPKTEIRDKSLLGLPWRYALACMDDLGLILRRDIIWSKPNGLPESVTDRCRSSHEYLFHFTRQPRYYAAVDEIREPHSGGTHARRKDGGGTPWAQTLTGMGTRRDGARLGGETDTSHPLGKLPGSVWDIPSQPLTVPPGLGVDHFAAYPMELPRRCVLGWSPPGVCTACGEGRRPVVDKQMTSAQRAAQPRSSLTRYTAATRGVPRKDEMDVIPRSFDATITGYACACTPYTDHPGTGAPGNMPHGSIGNVVEGGRYAGSDRLEGLGGRIRTGPWREYHFDDWTPPPTRPAVVLDPFGGTGTTALVAAAYGRTGISVDMSGDYSRLARWRTTDPAERAKAMMVAKPPPVPDGQVSLFDDLEGVS